MSGVPKLDDTCGRYFRYRELIECGETWKSAAASGLPIDNLPVQPKTYAALEELARLILDPLVEHFGRPQVTYAFASPHLTKHVSGRIAPTLDQHASYELRPDGQPICSRLGAAIDLLFPDHSSREVARWIGEEADFDRLYFYDDARPLHVSVGPARSRTVVLMVRASSGRLVPRVCRRDDL